MLKRNVMFVVIEDLLNDVNCITKCPEKNNKFNYFPRFSLNYIILYIYLIIYF